MSNEIEEETMLLEGAYTSSDTQEIADELTVDNAPTHIPPEKKLLPSMLEYDTLGGVPVRIIRPEGEESFGCHAFSKKGEILAIRETSDVVKLLRCCDYTIVGRETDLPAVDMSFVDNKDNDLRILEKRNETYNIVDLKIHRTDVDHGSSADAQKMLTMEVIRRTSLADIHEIGWCNFSQDGNTLMIDVMGDCIKVYSFEQESIRQCKLRAPTDVVRCPVLAPHGNSVFATCIKPVFVPSDLHDASVLVWPELASDLHTQDPVRIPGDRAVWIKDGRILAVWDYVGQQPRLKVYKTDDLKNDDPVRFRSWTFSRGLVNWKVFNGKDHSELIICEVYKSGVRRLVEWNLLRNQKPFETALYLPTKRTISLSSSTGESAFREECLECDLPVKSLQAFIQLAREDAYPLFRWYSDQRIGSFSWKHHSCVIASPDTGIITFSCTLPDDVLLSPIKVPIAVTFNQVNDDFLIIGDNAVIAITPTTEQNAQRSEYKTFSIPAKGLLDEIKSESRFRDAFRSFGNEALAQVLNSTEDPLIAKSETQSFSLELLQTAFSTSGDWIAFIGWDNSMRWRDSPFIGVLDAREIERGQEQITCKLITVDDSFHPTHVFTYARRYDEKDCIAFLSTEGPPLLVHYHIEDQKTMKITPEVRTCLAVSQTADRCNLVMLESKSVCIFDLETMSVEKRIDYWIDFEDILKMLERLLSKVSSRRDDVHNDLRMLSDDGQTVLLAWDSKERRPVVVTPTTELHACEAVIQNAGNCLSEHCQLTRNGSCTLFVDTDELSKGRVVVGLFSHKDLKVRYTICAIEDIPPTVLQGQGLKQLLSSTFYDLAEDGSEVIVLTIPDEAIKSDEFSIKREIKAFDIYTTEECIPDYDRFVQSQRTTAAEKVQQLYDRFGSGHVFNCCIYGNSIFIEAFRRGRRDIIQAIIDLAKHRSFKLAHRPSTFGIWNWVDQLAKDGMIEDLVNVLTSGTLTFSEMDVRTDTIFEDSNRSSARRFIKALLDDEFVIEICPMEVDTDCLDNNKTSSIAKRIFTTDEILDWILERDPAILSEKWRSLHTEVVEPIERMSHLSTRMASLKLIAVSGLLSPLSHGIIHLLLLYRAPESVFRCKAVKWIILHKWYELWRPRFIRRALLHVAFLIVLTIYVILLGTIPELIDADVPTQISSSVLVVVVCGYGLLMTHEEARQMSSFMDEDPFLFWKVRHYFSSKWNWVDMILCLLLVVLIPTAHFVSLGCGHGDQILSAFVAVESILGYIKMWYYAQPFTESGALVLMIENIIRDCIIFLTLLAIVMMGFALALHALFRGITSGDSRVDDADVAFGRYQSSLLTLFYALFGNFDELVYSSSHDLCWMVIIVFSLYMVSQSIVLLNMLISIMTDTFDRVKSNEEGQMLMARAMIIDSCEAGLSEDERREIRMKTERYICVLERVEGDSDTFTSRQWFGKLNDLQERFKSIIANSVAEMKRMLTREVAEVKNEIRSLDNRIEEQDKRIADIGDRMQQIQDHIEHGNNEISTKLERLFALLDHQRRE